MPVIAAPAMAMFMLVALATIMSPIKPAAHEPTTKYFRPNRSLPLEKIGARTAVQTATDCDSQTALPEPPMTAAMSRENY